MKHPAAAILTRAWFGCDAEAAARVRRGGGVGGGGALPFCLQWISLMFAFTPRFNGLIIDEVVTGDG